MVEILPQSRQDQKFAIEATKAKAGGNPETT